MSRRRGFTWLELCIIVAIIAILAWVLVPNFMRARTRSQGFGCRSNVANLGRALDRYGADCKGNYPVTLGQLTPRYLKAIPSCPMVGSVTYAYQGTQAGNASAFSVICAGDHGKFYPPNFPQYTSTQGMIEFPYQMQTPSPSPSKSP